MSKHCLARNKLIIEKFLFLENVRAPKNFDHRQTYCEAQLKIQFKLFYKINVTTEITAADFCFPLRQQLGTVVRIVNDVALYNAVPSDWWIPQHLNCCRTVQSQPDIKRLGRNLNNQINKKL